MYTTLPGECDLFDRGSKRRRSAKPRVAFADGLAATVRWYQENEEWWRPLKGRVA